MAQRMDVRQGMIVKSKDGHQIGRVIGMADDSFVVEKGVFYAKDYSVPFRSVQYIQDDEILLSLDRDQLHKASLGEVLEAGDRMHLEPESLSEARMDSARFFHGDKRMERAESNDRDVQSSVRPIGFDIDR